MSKGEAYVVLRVMGKLPRSRRIMGSISGGAKK